MDNWAVVIGVNDYKTPQHALKGAVNDAVAMATWLIRHGGVDRRNLWLHLSGAPLAVPPTRVAAADRSSIVDGIEQMLLRSGAAGDRVYIYFAGHGLSTSSGDGLQSAILPSDFRDTETDRSFTVASLFALLAGTDFKEQFVYIDACRNIPYDTNKRLGEYPNARTPRTPPWPQFVMYATQPGAKAADVRVPNDEHGAFTRALLDGLAGAGSAKVWDDTVGDYSVGWNSLFGYVERRVRALQLSAAAGGAWVQVPQQWGERGTQNPEFARLAETAVPKHKLRVTVSPEAARPRASLVVTDYSGKVEEVPAPLQAPQPLELLPRTYGLRSDAAGYRMRQRMEKIELYQDRDVDIELIPVGKTLVDPGPQIVSRSGGGQDLVFHVIERGPAGAARVPTGRVRIEAEDRLVWLELTTSTGMPVSAGRGRLNCGELKPGIYRASVIGPEGGRHETSVEVVAGEETLVRLAPAPAPATPMLNWAKLTGRMSSNDDGVIEPSESVGPAYFLKLSTLLTLAVGASNDPQRQHGHKLRSLGLPSFAALAGPHPPGGGGVYVVWGDETHDPASAIGARRTDAALICAAAGAPPTDPRRLTRHPSNDGIAFAATALEAGPHGLRLQLADASMTLPISVLPGWMALLVVTREIDGSHDVHHYQLALDPGDATSVWRRGMDKSEFATLRRVELMQRAVRAGRITPTRPDRELLLYDKWRDPIAGSLGCHLLLRAGEFDELRVPAGNLEKHFAGLPEGHLFQALVEERAGRPGDAIASLEAASSRGLPVFRDGLVQMVQLAARLRVPELAALAERWLKRVPQGALFSLVNDTSKPLERAGRDSSVRGRLR